LARAVQLLEGDDTAVDGVTEGTCLGPGLGHADQGRGEETLDVAGVGVADAFQVASLDFDYSLHDAAVAVLFGWLREDLRLDRLQSFVVCHAEKLGVGDSILAVAW